MKLAVLKYFKIDRSNPLKLWLLWVLIIGSAMQSINATAGTAVSLRESYAGNLSFALTGGSFRNAQNNDNACSTDTTSSNSVSNVPVGADVKAAYLYWAASGNGSYIDNQVVLNGALITADRMYTEDTGSWDFFSGVADITSIVKTQPNRTYTITGLDIYSTFNHCNSQTTLGGWALAIIYESDFEDFRVLNLYEGFQSYQNSTVTLIPDNFKLPSNPTGKHAHITWEGDDTLGTDGEYLEFEGVRLTDITNPSNNQFNSYSNVQGGFTSYGVDIDEYDISPYLIEGATSVHTEYSAGQDLVLLSAELVSVSNIPVADLSVTTSTPTAWTQGSNISKKFTISNNGPNDVPTQSVRFSTTLPSQLSFNGVTGNSDWSCNQNGQQLSCIYQNKLRSGWSNYLDLNLSVAAGTAGQTANWPVTVDHNTAPYDIFDNHQPNDTTTLNVPIVATPVVDLSASSKTYSNLSGDSLLAGDTLQYTITIDDASDLTTNAIQLYDDLPANISGYNIISMPSGAVSNSTNWGGANGTGFLDIQNINLASGDTAEVVFEVYVNNSAPKGASLQNTATLSYNGNDWIIDTGDITVVEPDLSPSSIELVDSDGGLLEAGNTLDVTITLQDKADLDINNLQVTSDIPEFISSFLITNIPAGATDNSETIGGANGTGFLDITNIDFGSGETPSITLRLSIDPATPKDTVLNMSSLLSIGLNTWSISSDSLIVSDGTPTSTGNKQLYLDTSLGLSRNRPASGTTDIQPESERTWTLTPQLLSDLTFNLTDITVEAKIGGHRNGYTLATITYTLRDTDGVLLASETLNNVSIRSGRIDDVTTTLQKNTALPDQYTIQSGKGLTLTIRNDSFNGQTNSNRRISVYTLDNLDNSRKADGYSAVIINASTVINVDNIQVWSAPFNDTNSDFADDSGATLITSSQPDTTLSIRADISDPFGAFDINETTIEIKKSDNSPYLFSDNTMIPIDDPSDDTATVSKRFEATFTLAEQDEITGGWTISVTSKEGVEGDVEHTNIKGFTVLPFLPSITLNKTIEVISDPINGSASSGNKPKAIPGAELLYRINAVNTGRGKSDNNSIVLIDEIPDNAEFYIGDLSCSNRGSGTGSGPICFEDGLSLNESNLTYNFLALDDLTDHLDFSADGSDFSYEPQDSGDNYDPNIRFIRIKPSGVYKNSDKNNTYTPEFDFSYQIRLQ